MNGALAVSAGYITLLLVQKSRRDIKLAMIPMAVTMITIGLLSIALN